MSIVGRTDHINNVGVGIQRNKKKRKKRNRKRKRVRFLCACFFLIFFKFFFRSLFLLVGSSGLVLPCVPRIYLLKKKAKKRKERRETREKLDLKKLWTKKKNDQTLCPGCPKKDWQSGLDIFFCLKRKKKMSANKFPSERWNSVKKKNYWKSIQQLLFLVQ